MKNIYLFFLTIFITFSFAQSIDFKKLESEIERDILQLDHVKAQKKLLSILETQAEDDFEKSSVLLMIASTYRSIDDYPTCIKYLLEAEKVSANLTDQDSLQQKIQAKLALAYFDSRQYQKSDELMKKLNLNNYKNLEPRDKAYIIMQEGYLLQLKNKLSEAEIKYDKSLQIMNQVSPCHSPVIKVKKMELLAMKNEVDNAEALYHRIIQKADSCKILKYKIYATAQLINIFQIKNLYEKSGYYSKLLSNYEIEYDRDKKLSNLHLEKSQYLESETNDERSKALTQTIIYIISSLFLLIIILIIFRKAFKNRVEKEKMEVELNRMQFELNEFIASTKTKEPESKEYYFPNIEKLTARQKELLGYMTEGLSNREIGEKLFITESTVKYHISKIYELLELKNRKELINKLSKSNSN